MGTLVVVGVLAGAVPALMEASGLPVRWMVYPVIGILVASIAPAVVSLAGSLDRLLWIVLVVSLQLELTFAPITWGYQKPAGPYGILISVTLLAAAALVLTWGSRRLWAREQRFQVERRFWVASACFLATAVLSLSATPDRTLSAFGLFEILSLILIAAVVCHLCSSRQGIETARSILFVSAGVQAALIMIEQSLGVQISLAHGVKASHAVSSEARFAGTLAVPSAAALFLVVCLLFLLGIMWSKERPERPAALWCAFSAGFLALLLTRTRSAWIAFTIGAIGLGWRCYREGTLSKRVVTRLLVGGLLAFLVAWPLVAERLNEDHVRDKDVRMNLVWIAMAMIKAHPLTGIGLNTATSQVQQYAAAAGFAGGWVFIVHNQFVLIACETGLPGLAAFLLVVSVAIRSARRCMQSHGAMIREMGAVLFWALVAMIWALNLDHVTGGALYRLFWFLIGASCGLDVLRQREERRSAAGAGLPVPRACAA